MKVFICAFGGFYAAVPMDRVASLTDLSDQHSAAQNAVVVRDTETYVSLPLLLNLPHEKLRHGIVLKTPGDDENKIVLLSTEVVNTGEINPEKIHPIPNALRGTRFSELFGGMQCAAEATRDAGLVLMLDTERVIQYARQEAAE